MKFITTVFVLFLSFSVNALTLQEAKKSGFLGELPNGYIGLVIPNGEAKRVMSIVNSKRRALFQKIAKKNGLSVHQTAKIAAKKFITKTISGNYFKNSAGKWVKK